MKKREKNPRKKKGTELEVENERKKIKTKGR
jgi:hypothetical protein